MNPSKLSFSAQVVVEKGRTVLLRTENSPEFRKIYFAVIEYKQSKTGSQKNIIYLASRYTHGVTANQIYISLSSDKPRESDRVYV